MRKKGFPKNEHGKIDSNMSQNQNISDYKRLYIQKIVSGFYRDAPKNYKYFTKQT